MSDEFIIREVKTSRDLKKFINLPWQINKDDKNWVPPLKLNLHQTFDLQKNPFWRYYKSAFYIAEQNGSAVGRITAIMPCEINTGKSDATGYFGFLEAFDNQEIFRQLLHTVENWLASNGCKKITGPVNPGTNYELGILTDGFDTPPFFMLTHNPRYYPGNIKACGFTKEKDFYSYFLEAGCFILTDKMNRTMEALKNRNSIKIRKVCLKDFKNEMKIFHQVYNDAFRFHWGFQPMPEDEFQFMAKNMVQIMDPDLALVLEYAGEPAGFILALPDLNEVLIKIKNGRLFPSGIFKFIYYKKKIKQVRVLTIAIKHKYQHLGLGSFLYHSIVSNIQEKGYSGGEMSWVVEDNIPMNKAALEMGGKIYKTYRLYSKLI